MCWLRLERQTQLPIRKTQNQVWRAQHTQVIQRIRHKIFDFLLRCVYATDETRQRSEQAPEFALVW